MRRARSAFRRLALAALAVALPAFLPELIHARWVDVHNLAAEIEEKKLPRSKATSCSAPGTSGITG